MNGSICLTVSLSHSVSLHAASLMFYSASFSLCSCLAGVCLEGQSGASCFTSCAASSRSQISTNCSNNNTTGARARSSDSQETRDGGRANHGSTVKGLCGEKWEGRCQLRFNRKEHESRSHRRRKQREEESPITRNIVTGSKTSNNAAIPLLLERQRKVK